MTYTNALAYLTVGLVVITLIDTLGAIASRKLNFNYAYLTIPSFVVYTGIGYLTSEQYGLSMAMLVNGLLGLYDGTIGFRLSIINKANTGLDTEKSKEDLDGKTALVMIFLSFVFALVGFGISKI
jgi:hypothetical protein